MKTKSTHWFDNKTVLQQREGEDKKNKRRLRTSQEREGEMTSEEGMRNNDAEERRCNGTIKLNAKQSVCVCRRRNDGHRHRNSSQGPTHSAISCTENT
jgi:hypothetical protein